MPASTPHDEEIPKRLDKETINELPLIRFHGAIQVAEDSKSFNRYASRLKKQRVLGLISNANRTSSRDSNNPPALIQLATADQAFLFRLYPVMKLGRWSRSLKTLKSLRQEWRLRMILKTLIKSKSANQKGLKIWPLWPNLLKLNKLDFVI